MARQKQASVLKPLPSFIEGKLHEINIKWNLSHTTSFKLNTSDSFIGHFSLSSCGGLMRNSMGCFIRGFTFDLGRSTSVMVKLWGLVHGLRLVNNLGIDKLSERFKKINSVILS